MSNDHPDDPGHGDSLAAWTAVIIIILGFIGGTAGFWFGNEAVIYVSAALLPLGVVAGFVLAKLGFGVER